MRRRRRGGAAQQGYIYIIIEYFTVKSQAGALPGKIKFIQPLQGAVRWCV